MQAVDFVHDVAQMHSAKRRRFKLAVNVYFGAHIVKYHFWHFFKILQKSDTWILTDRSLDKISSNQCLNTTQTKKQKQNYRSDGLYLNLTWDSSLLIDRWRKSTEDFDLCATLCVTFNFNMFYDHKMIFLILHFINYINPFIRFRPRAIMH